MVPSNFLRTGTTDIPMDGDECMDSGRTIEKYHVGTRLLTRPIGASWNGDGDKPTASSNKRVFVNDTKNPEDDQLRPSEAESLMGFAQGFTECPGITAKERLCAIGNSFDMNVIVPLLALREPSQDHAVDRAVALLPAELSPALQERQAAIVRLQKEDNKVPRPHGDT
jgi:hypothetical protein